MRTLKYIHMTWSGLAMYFPSIDKWNISCIPARFDDRTIWYATEPTLLVISTSPTIECWNPLHGWYSQEYLVFYLKMQLSPTFVSVTLLHVDSALLSLVFSGTIVELISQACYGSGTMWLGWVIWRLRLQSWASRIFWNWASQRIDWLHEVEWIFEYKEVPNRMEVKIVFIKQKGRTFAWCENLKRSRDKPGKSKI